MPACRHTPLHIIKKYNFKSLTIKNQSRFQMFCLVQRLTVIFFSKWRSIPRDIPLSTSQFPYISRVILPFSVLCSNRLLRSLALPSCVLSLIYSGQASTMDHSQPSFCFFYETGSYNFFFLGCPETCKFPASAPPIPTPQ